MACKNSLLKIKSISTIKKYWR